MKRNKITLIVVGVVITIFIGIFMLAQKNPSDKSEMNQSTQFGLSTPIPSIQSGGQKNAFEAIITRRPEFVIEAKLRDKMPIEGDGFTITYDYKRIIFDVHLIPNTPQSKINFMNWAKMQGLNDLSNFLVH